MISNYNDLSKASMLDLQIAENSLRSELRNKSHPKSVHDAAQKNLKKILTAKRALRSRGK